MQEILILIIEFFKTGLFSIGGGLATMPFLVEMGEKYGFFNYEELLTMLAVSESTPGAIGINMATYVGIKIAGIIGGIVSSLSLVLPSIIIILIIAKIIDKYKNNENMQNIMEYLKPISVGFIAAAVIPLIFAIFSDKSHLELGIYLLLIVAVIFIRERYNKLHPGIIILATFIVGLLIDIF